jgi:hypothetical protein
MDRKPGGPAPASPTSHTSPSRPWYPVRASRGPIVTWKTPGEALEGRWAGFGPGQFERPLGTLTTEAGPVPFAVPVALERDLRRIRVGAEIRIVYRGLESTKNGRDFKSFDVSVGNPADILPRESEVQPWDADAPPRDTDPPF